MPQIPDHVPQFSSAQTADAAGVTLDTLKNWVSRKPQVILLTTEERAEGGRGRPILFSRNRVVQIALTARLVDMGWQPRAATEAAVHFTDVGDMNRGVCRLFDTGTTLLAVSNAKEGQPAAVVIQAEADMPWHLVFHHLNRGNYFSALVILNVSEIVASVHGRLGL